MNEFNQTTFDNPQNDFNQSVNKKSGAFAMTKVFLYMFIGLIITAIVAFAFGAIFAYSGIAPGTLFVIMLVCSILQILFTGIMMGAFSKGKGAAILPAIAYCFIMGLMMSSFTLYIDWRVLGLAFTITAFSFLVMTLISKFVKNVKPLATVGYSLLAGCGFFILFNLIFMWLAPTVFVTSFWFIEAIVFFAIMIITLVDVKQISKICAAGGQSEDLNLFCAFRLYVDFIAIFLRVLLLIVMFGKRN